MLDVIGYGISAFICSVVLFGWVLLVLVWGVNKMMYRLFKYHTIPISWHNKKYIVWDYIFKKTNPSIYSYISWVDEKRDNILKKVTSTFLISLIVCVVSYSIYFADVESISFYEWITSNIHNISKYTGKWMVYPAVLFGFYYSFIFFGRKILSLTDKLNSIK